MARLGRTAWRTALAAAVLATGIALGRAAHADDTALAARVAAINTAGPPATGRDGAERTGRPSAALIKAQVLLARAHASPGAVDGLAGSNLKRALAAFEAMHGAAPDGRLTRDVWNTLNQASPGPVAALYTVTPDDVAGPFYPDTGGDFVAAAKLPAMGYARPAQMLAERFHMSEALLAALNPGADFSRPGTEIVVLRPEVPPLAKVDHIAVDKSRQQVRAYDADGALMASFPATVGSRERPSPSGVRKVRWVTFDPIYTYDPRKLSWGPRGARVLVLRPGPENPVGVVWIALNAPGYGIHGAPNPALIGKTQSHGCVRLTNWDAALLAHAVKPGVVVAFASEADRATGPG